uniref:LRAT domain-containing protein n=1 Tax=Denticeps clupeoides TaxID=299321 RepID=A0AAY4DT09_9TELE
WGVYDEDGVIVTFQDEGQLMHIIRNSLQTVFPLCGDILLGETKIRRQHLTDINVPTGAQVLISNNRHACQPSPEDDMRKRRDSLLDKELSYKLFTLNCEHFATFVRYGIAVCNQVQQSETANAYIYVHALSTTFMIIPGLKKTTKY